MFLFRGRRPQEGGKGDGFTLPFPPSTFLVVVAAASISSSSSSSPRFSRLPHSHTHPSSSRLEKGGGIAVWRWWSECGGLLGWHGGGGGGGGEGGEGRMEEILRTRPKRTEDGKGGSSSSSSPPFYSPAHPTTPTLATHTKPLHPPGTQIEGRS